MSAATSAPNAASGNVKVDNLHGHLSDVVKVTVAGVYHRSASIALGDHSAQARSSGENDAVSRETVGKRRRSER